MVAIIKFAAFFWLCVFATGIAVIVAVVLAIVYSLKWWLERRQERLAASQGAAVAS